MTAQQHGASTDEGSCAHKQWKGFHTPGLTNFGDYVYDELIFPREKMHLVKVGAQVGTGFLEKPLDAVGVRMHLAIFMRLFACTKAGTSINIGEKPVVKHFLRPLIEVRGWA